MELLRFFESIRNPFLDRFFSVVTTLGEETMLGKINSDKYMLGGDYSGQSANQ